MTKCEPGIRGLVTPFPLFIGDSFSMEKSNISCALFFLTDCACNFCDVILYRNDKLILIYPIIKININSLSFLQYYTMK